MTVDILKAPSGTFQRVVNSLRKKVEEMEMGFYAQYNVGIYCMGTTIINYLFIVRQPLKLTFLINLSQHFRRFVVVVQVQSIKRINMVSGLLPQYPDMTACLQLN